MNIILLKLHEIVLGIAFSDQTIDLYDTIYTKKVHFREGKEEKDGKEKGNYYFFTQFRIAPKIEHRIKPIIRLKKINK